MEKNRVMLGLRWLILSLSFMLVGCDNSYIPVTTSRILVNESGYDVILVGIAKSNDPYEVWTYSENFILKNGDRYRNLFIDEELVGNRIDWRIYINGVYMVNNLGDRSPQKEENYVSQKKDESNIELIYTFTAEDYQNALKQE